MELRLILGDQLHPGHSWFSEVDQNVTYVMMEVREEASYAPHHIQKILCFFAAMRHFAADLRKSGHQVKYLSISDSQNCHSIIENLKILLETGQYSSFCYQEPDEYRLDHQLKEFVQSQNIQSQLVSSEHFLVRRNEFSVVFPGKSQGYLMETFYRHIRKKENLLMEQGKPMFGKWNFDAENRKKLPKNLSLPDPVLFQNDLSHIQSELSQAGIQGIGRVDAANIFWPVTRDQALQLLSIFCDRFLPDFGTYQDAMTVKSWSVFHARISFALNVKLLSPSEVIEAAVSSWKNSTPAFEFHQLEGFVRQIAGWREYMRCLYWSHMPEYAQMNFFQHHRKLPVWYWTGQTKMNCLSHAIGQSLEYAYAHHIQRLMVTGNFALLAGIDPDEVDQWYLGIYIDAIEWVEITNTRGMSQYADGGLAATKPYVSSAAYIDKMSDYCTQCHYVKTLKTGKNACPFNSLYWSFLESNREKLITNPRMTMMYRVLDKMSTEDRNALMKQAEIYLSQLDDL